MPRAGVSLLLVACCAALAVLSAQEERLPTARLVSASRVVMPGAVDSSVPMVWDLEDGGWRLFAFASWGGVPVRLAGASLEGMQRLAEVGFDVHPGHGVWIESVIPDEQGVWYGYYHHEVPAEVCGRPDRAIPKIGAVRSSDRGETWEDLGVIFEAAAESHACGSGNRFVLGGVGDVSVMLSDDRQDLYLFVTQYSRHRAAQGVAVARMAWADRDEPAGKVQVWREGIWMLASEVAADDGSLTFAYPSGTPLVAASRPWHDGNDAADAFWGPSIHWNTYLERYVMLLNRAKDERFNNEGIYVSYARALDDPRAWSAPRKIKDGGNWYPQVAGLEAQHGTDKQAGQRARFFLTGRSEQMIEFSR